MSKKKLMLLVAVIMCVSILVAAFVGCDDKVSTVYKVTFDSNGGSEVAAVEGVVATEPVPSKEGYVFGGWYADKECAGSRITFPYTPVADVTMYAKWNENSEEGGDETQPNFNIVTFESNGGSEVTQVIGVVSREPVPTKENCTFEGWYTSSSFTGQRVTFPFTPTANTKLYAKWREDFNMTIAIREIVNALRTSMTFDGSKAFGTTVNAEIAGIGLAFDMNINPENPADIRAKLAVTDNGNNVISLWVDDTNMYAVTPDAQKRFVNVDLAGFIKDASFNAPDDMTYTIISAALNAVFSGGTATRQGSVYTLEGSLAGVADLIGLLGLDIPQEILDVLAGLDVTAIADFNGGTMNSLDVQLSAAGIGAGAKVNELKIANDYAPVTDTPAKDAAGFDESYALNFTIEGSVSFGKNNSDYTTSQLVNMTYELRVDFNIFEALRNCISYAEDGTMIFDATQLFNTSDSRIYLDVYHKCTDDCGDFCAGKVAASKGSFLTLAYSPEDFGNTDLRAAINLKYIVPQGWIEGLVGSLPIDIWTFFGEYTGLNIDPAALILQDNIIEKDGALALAGEGSAISLPEGMNILDVIFDVADFASTVVYGQADGVTIGVNELLDILADLTPLTGGTNIANMLQPFFGGADTMNIKVDKAIYGDPETTTIDIWREFMIISDDMGEYKDFGSRDFAKDIEWVKGNDGNVILTSGDVSTHDAEGNPIKLTEDEVRTLIESGSAKYTYTTIYGVQETSSQGALLIKANGIDFNVYDTPQSVTFATTLADGGSVSSLLSLVASFAGLDVEIPGAVFTTNITISSVKSIEFYQPAQVDDGKGEMVDNNPIDEEKEYKYDDKLNPQFIAKITFSDDTVKEMKVDPAGFENIFYNYSTRYKAQVRMLGDFDLVYSAYGQTFTKHINMADQLVAEEPTVVDIATGDKYLVSNSVKVKYNLLDESSTQKELSVSANEADMLAIDVEGMTVEGYYTDGFLGPTFKGVNLSFDKPGTYTVSVPYKSNVVKEYVFNVTEKKVLPGYNAEITATSADTFKVVVSRKDQYGSGINANVEIELNNKEGVLTKLAAEDFYLYTMVNGEEVKLDNLFLDYFLPVNYEFYIKITNPEYVAASSLNVIGKVSIIAPDYNNEVVTSTEFTDKTEAYSLTIGDTTVKSEQSSYVGYVFDITPVCPADKAVKGISFTHEIKLTIGEEVITLASGQYKFASYDAEKATYGYASFNFSEDGTSYGKQLCLIVTDAGIVEKIAAAEAAINVEYNVYASNYNNVLVAGAKTDVTVQAATEPEEPGTEETV